MKPDEKVRQVILAYETEVLNPAIKLLDTGQLALLNIEDDGLKDSLFALHERFRSWYRQACNTESDEK